MRSSFLARSHKSGTEVGGNDKEDDKYEEGERVLPHDEADADDGGDDSNDEKKEFVGGGQEELYKRVRKFIDARDERSSEIIIIKIK